MAATLASSTAGISFTCCSRSARCAAVPVMCTSPCAVAPDCVRAPVVASRTRSTARPEPTGPVRVSTPLILLATSGLLDPVTPVSTFIAITLGCDSNHVGTLDYALDDPVGGYV